MVRGSEPDADRRVTAATRPQVMITAASRGPCYQCDSCDSQNIRSRPVARVAWVGGPKELLRNPLPAGETGFDPQPTARCYKNGCSGYPQRHEDGTVTTLSSTRWARQTDPLSSLLLFTTMTPEDFRIQLLRMPADEIVDQIILTTDPGPHTSREALSELETRIRAKFDLERTQELATLVVGSAKLGFAILDKPARKGRPSQPAYRSYKPGESDIDVAVVSAALYGTLWQELARFAANQSAFPYQGVLAAYMMNGWLRPDKFPFAAPQRCTDWKELMNDVSRSVHFRYKKLRCGIFHSTYFLRIYQQRGVRAAQQAERGP